MSKCVITGNETKNKTNNVPLSREGRVELDNIVKDYNQKVKDGFVEEQTKLGNVNTEILEKIAPQFAKAHILRMIADEGVDELFATLKQAQEDIAEENNEEE